jgi:hypothetical protein
MKRKTSIMDAFGVIESDKPFPAKKEMKDAVEKAAVENYMGV